MPAGTTASPPYAVPCPGPSGSAERYALVSADGRLVRAPELSAVGPLHPDRRGGFVAPAADDEGRCGYVDHRGAWPGAPALACTGAFEDGGLSRFQAPDGHWGYAGADGIPVIAATWTKAGVFREGVAAARTEDGVGFIDTSGGFVIRPQYAAAGPFAPNGLAGVRMADGGRCGYVDRTGRMVIGPRFDGAKPSAPTGRQSCGWATCGA
ncbi:WG repeat-containing protein [Streptomyces sp. NPDC002181]|uniref:WG repeat-containing protein n=1 Tax=Streptomyces sp. NPDC002181 TaxID=3364635 RepID=UPI0036B50CE4